MKPNRTDLKDINGYEGLYKITREGRVWVCERFVKNGHGFKKCGNHFIRGNNALGYRTVSLVKDNKKSIFRVHRLVAFTFIQNPLNKPYINHKNANRADNRVENLEWCTQEENLQHAARVGLMPTGERNFLSKLSNEEIISIRKLYKEGLSQKELGKMFGVLQSNVSRIVQRKTWQHI